MANLWLDASDTASLFKDECSTATDTAETNGDSVRCWRDKSGLGNHVEAAAGEEATYTTGQANGKSLTSFWLGANTTWALAQFSGNQAHTIFVVRELSQTSGTAEFDLYIGNTINTNEAIHVFKSPAGQAANGFYNKATITRQLLVPPLYIPPIMMAMRTSTDRIRSWTNGDISKVILRRT